ncbi:MAG: hypothetical protein RLZZ127_1949 [Planctomycetota bacterium]|jgi:AraC family transcriptional regulator
MAREDLRSRGRPPVPPPVQVHLRTCWEIRSPALRVPAHRHDDAEILLIRRGTYRCTIDGRAVIAPAPALVLVLPGDRHADTGDGPVELVSAQIDLFPGSLAPTALLADRAVDRAWAVAPDGPVAGAMARLHDEVHGGGPGSAALLDALAAELLWRALRLLPPAALHPALRAGDDGLRSRIEAVLRPRLHRPPTVTALARSLGLAERTLRWRCARELGGSPARLIARLRAERARELLAAGATVAGAARALGFADAGTFARTYRRRWGCAPAANRSPR